MRAVRLISDANRSTSPVASFCRVPVKGADAKAVARKNEQTTTFIPQRDGELTTRSLSSMRSPSSSHRCGMSSTYHSVSEDQMSFCVELGRLPPDISRISSPLKD